jgi:hypothetical protein
MSNWTSAEELIAMRQRLRELPGWSVRSEMLSLDRSLRVFTGNARELSQILGEQQEPANAFHLWALQNHEGFERFLDEVDRLLHNFVAGAMSLKEHATRLRRKLLSEDSADELAAEYQDRVDRDFTNSPLAQFVQQVRNFTTHRRLPVTTGELSMEIPSETVESRVILHASDLLKWPKWNPLAKRYIETAGDEIAIADVVTEYTAVVVSFHGWFREALAIRHRKDLDALKQAEAEVAELWERAFGRPIFDPTDET